MGSVTCTHFSNTSHCHYSINFLFSFSSFFSYLWLIKLMLACEITFLVQQSFLIVDFLFPSNARNYRTQKSCLFSHLAELFRRSQITSNYTTQCCWMEVISYYLREYSPIISLVHDFLDVWLWILGWGSFYYSPLDYQNIFLHLYVLCHKNKYFDIIFSKVLH